MAKNNRNLFIQGIIFGFNNLTNLLNKTSDTMLWQEIEELARRLGAHTTMVLKEQVQKSVLTEMALKGCFATLVFQGGTALRLFYDNPRFSEDIDLVFNHRPGMPQNGYPRGFDLSPLLPAIERAVGATFPFFQAVQARAQKTGPEMNRYVLLTESADLDHKLRLHIELAAVPSYSNHPLILKNPPINPAIRVETVEEILADKVCALALRPYLKGRDLWDIHFLVRERSVGVDWGLVLQKVGDYLTLDSDTTRNSKESLEKGLIKAREKIEHEGYDTLENELLRFLPQQVLEAYRSSLGSIVETVKETVAR